MPPSRSLSCSRHLHRAGCLILLALLAACAHGPRASRIDSEGETRAVERAIHDSIGWALNKDFARLYNVIANDDGYLEVDPTPGVIRGFAEFRKNEAFWGDPNFKAMHFSFAKGA